MTSANQPGPDHERERLKQQLRQRLGQQKGPWGPLATPAGFGRTVAAGAGAGGIAGGGATTADGGTSAGGGPTAGGGALGGGGPTRPVVALDELVPGTTHAAHHGTAYVVRRPVVSFTGGRELEERYVAAMVDPESALHRRLRAAGYAADLALPDCILLDIETAGLGNVPIFLVGTICWTDGGLEAVQFLARDYAEEGPALALWQAQAQQRGLLVTFNGKSFDLPCVRSRLSLSRLPCAWDPCHLDLLHESRRVWGRVLPDCRLQTLEQYVCRRYRSDDIPGAQIPDVYHHFVRTADARLLARVVEHNAWDLVTLADLLLRLPAPA